MGLGLAFVEWTAWGLKVKEGTMSRTAGWSVRPLDESNLDDYASIAGESLLGTSRSGWDTYFERVGRENMYGIFSRDTLVGGLGLYRMGQWFGGRCLSAAGVSGVAISPAERGQGAARSLLETILQQLRSEGIPVATLFASTQRLYRSVGFEQSGTRLQYQLPLRAIPTEVSTLDVHRYPVPELERLEGVASERARRGQGNLQRSHGLWQRLLEPFDASSITYLFGPSDRPEGYLILRRAGRAVTLPQPLDVIDMAASTPLAARAVWAFLAGHSSLNDVVRWFGSPAEPLAAHVDGAFLDVALHQVWMSRIVDLPAALSLRGYPQDMETELELAVEDPLLTANDGCWQIRIRDGQATVRSGGAGRIRLSIRALAPLFTGYWRASQLAELGLLATPHSNDLSLIDRVFAGPAPWMPEAF